MREVGRYEILERIGSGGMAVVHLARQRDLDRFVALKELSALHAEDPSWASRFLRESRLAGSLTHANIVTVFDYFEADGTPFIAMEYLERGPLRPYLGALDLAQIGGVLADVLAGLGHAERRGIVHRDLKPENLLVTAEGQVKIADFGIAKATCRIAGPSLHTQAGVAVGTPGYMAPEQAMAREIGSWSDLYSVGCMAYEMLVGALPFSETTEPFALMLRHIGEPIPPVYRVNPSVDFELSRWVDSLLAKAPAGRVRRASEAWESLDEILFRVVGPRWRRTSTLPPVVVSANAVHWTSSVIDQAELVARMPRTDEVPETMPGPYTPPSSDASDEIAVLDPDGYVSVDVRALGTPSRSEPLLTPAPAGPAPPLPTDALPIDGPAEVAGHALLAPAGETLAPADTFAPLRPALARRRRRPLAAAGAVSVVGAVVAVVALTADDPPAPPAQHAAKGPSVRTIAAGPLSATVPAAWSAGGAAPADFKLTGVAGAKPPGAEGAVVVGMAPPSTHALLPADLLKNGRAPARTEVALGSTRAYRYDALPGGLIVYAAPTDQGVATVVCEAPAAAACATVAATLKLDGPRALALGPDADYAAAVNAAIGGLRTTALRSARTPSGQARAAGRAHDSFVSAAKRLARVQPGPIEAAPTAALLKAFDGGASAYARLSSAARHHQPVRYRAAGRDAAAARTRIGEALRDLADAGYRDLERPAAAGIPSLARPPRTTPAHKAVGPTTTGRPVATATPRAISTQTIRPTRTVTPKATPKPTPVPAKPTPQPTNPSPTPSDSG